MNIHRGLFAIAIVVSFAASGSAALIDVTVNGGESLVLQFHQPDVPPPETDTLKFTTGLQPPFSFDGSTYTLIDGDTFLGSVDNVGTNLFAHFTKAGSATVSIAVNVDYTSILAGTLAGRLVVTPHGSARFIAPVIESFHANSDGGGELPTFRTMIIDRAFAAPTASIPEPATAVLMVVAFGAIAATRGRHSRWPTRWHIGG